MFIYKKEVLNSYPTITNTKKYVIHMEDVLLNFISSEVKGENIIITYSISYFNIPQNVSEVAIESKIDMFSLRKVIYDTVGALGQYVQLYYLSGKQVKFIFNAKEFLSRASYPCNVINKPKMNEIVLKLNQKVPDIIIQTSSEYLQKLFSDVMTSIIRNNRKYRHIFSRMKSWAYSKVATVNAEYNVEKNLFDVTINNPFKLLYYYV